MPRRLSFNARVDIANAEHVRVPVILVTIVYRGEIVARLSTDPTVRFSAEPLRYGTSSRGDEYEFVLMSAVVPSDQERTPMASTLEFENVAADIAKVIRSMDEWATVNMELVYSDDPDFVEDRWSGMLTTRARVNGSTVSIDISRDPLTREGFPSHTISPSRFGGLF